MKQLFEFVHAQHPIQQPRAVLTLHSLWAADSTAKGNVPGDRFENVVVGQQTLDAAVFVDYQSDMLSGLFERIQHFERTDRSRNEQGLLKQRPEIKRMPSEVVSQQVFGVHDAGDRIEAAVSHRET